MLDHPERLRNGGPLLRRLSLAGAGLAALGLGACTALPEARITLCADAVAPTPRVSWSADGREASTTLDVLTFNIEGLGWPTRRNRAPRLRQIGVVLAELNARRAAPDIVLIQEMFSPAAVRAMTDAGFRQFAWGPSRTQRKALPVGQRMAGPFQWRKGETGFHLVGSGLAILSRYPIVASRSEPFGKRACAGFDCLSNKGMQYARVVLPGVPQPIDIFNTHLNSQGASRVPRERNGAAHAIQTGDLARFLTSAGDHDAPAILGGDFNMRGSPDRLARFDRDLGRLTLVHRYCAMPRSTCDVRVSWDGDAPWMDTEDLQLFNSGRIVSIRPIRIEAMFDGSAGNPQLSDHDGLRVRYRLTWRPPGGQGNPANTSTPACEATPVPTQDRKS